MKYNVSAITALVSLISFFTSVLGGATEAPIVPASPPVWIKSGGAYDDFEPRDNIGGMITISSNAVDSFEKKLTWDVSGVMSQPQKTYPNVVKEGRFKRLSNGNLATFHAQSARVQIYNESLTSLISEVETTSWQQLKFLDDYYVTMSNPTGEVRFFSLNTESGSDFTLTMPVSIALENLMDVLVVDRFYAICQPQSISFFDRTTRQFVKSVVIKDCNYFGAHQNEICCVQRVTNGDIYKFTPETIPHGYLVGELQRITTESFWEKLFGVRYFTNRDNIEVRVIDGMIHLITRVVYLGDNQGLDRYTYITKNAYLVIDVASGQVVFRGDFEANSNIHSRLGMFIEGSKTLFIRDRFTGTGNIGSYQHIYFERNPTWPFVDVSRKQGSNESNSIMVEFSLRTASANIVTVDYHTADATAFAGEDYVNSTGSIVFAPGELKKSLSIAVEQDQKAEGVEHFTLHLDPKNDCVVSQREISCVIDDSANTYNKTSVGPNQLISDKSVSYERMAYFNDSFLMHRTINGNDQFTLFDALTFLPLRDLIMPSTLSGKLVGVQKKFAKFGNRIVVCVQRSTEVIFLAFNFDTGELISEYSLPLARSNQPEFTILNQHTIAAKDQNEFLTLYAIADGQNFQINQKYLLFSTDSEGKLQALRKVTEHYYLDVIDLPTGNVLNTIDLSHVHDQPLRLYNGKLLCKSAYNTYCYDTLSGELLWTNYNKDSITDISADQILLGKAVYDLHTGVLIEELNIADTIVGFMGRHLYSTNQFYRNEANPSFPETPTHLVFVRRNQGYTTLTFPLSAPLPNESKVEFLLQDQAATQIITAGVTVAAGATKIEIPVYVKDRYPHTNTNGNPTINQTRILSFSNVSTGFTYSQQIGLQYLSPDFNHLGMPNATVPRVNLDSTTENIFKILANEEYFAVIQGPMEYSYATKIDVYSKALNQKILTITRDSNAPVTTNLGRSMVLRGKYLFVGCPGIKYVDKNIPSYEGYVDIYDLETQQKVSTIQGPKKDYGFALELSANAPYLAVTSQIEPFQKLNLRDEKKPIKYKGKVYLYDLSNIATPVLRRTITNKESGFGTSIAMNEQHIFASAPHATVSFKSVGSKKTTKASYSGVVFRYSLTNPKEVSVIHMPAPFPLAEFGHSLSLNGDDLSVACIRSYFPGTITFPTEYIAPQGFTFDAKSLQVTGWLPLSDEFETVSQGGQFLAAKDNLYSVDTAMLVSRAETEHIYIHENKMSAIVREPYTYPYRYFYYSRPLELSGDFAFWSRFKLGNYGAITASVDHNNNGITDWQEFLNEHKAFYQNPLLYEETNQRGYGSFEVNYEYLNQFPLPPVGTWSDWINH